MVSKRSGTIFKNSQYLSENIFARWQLKIRSMPVYSIEGQTQQPTSSFSTTCVLQFLFLNPSAKQSLLKLKWKPLHLLWILSHAGFLTLPFQPDVAHGQLQSLNMMEEQSTSLDTYQLAMDMNLTVGAYDPGMLSSLFTPVLHSL